MSAHRTMPGDLTRLAGSDLKSADAHAAIPRRKQSWLLNLDGAATSWLFVTLPGSRAVSVLGGGTLPAGLPGVDPSGAQMRPGAGTGRPANCGGTCCQVWSCCWISC